MASRSGGFGHGGGGGRLDNPEKRSQRSEGMVQVPQ